MQVQQKVTELLHSSHLSGDGGLIMECTGLGATSDVII